MRRFAQVVPEAIEMCRDGAKFLVLGHYGDAGEVSITRITSRGSSSTSTGPGEASIGTWHRHWSFSNQGGRFPFEELVTHRFPLDRVMEAIETTQKWQ